MATQRRRHRSVHQPRSLWPGRAGCVLVLGGVVALGLWRPAAEVDVDRLSQGQDARVCSFMDAIAALALVGISPPPDPTPEDVAAVHRVNAQLAQVREHLRSLDGMEGCR